MKFGKNPNANIKPLAPSTKKVIRQPRCCAMAITKRGGIEFPVTAIRVVADDGDARMLASEWVHSNP